MSNMYRFMNKKLILYEVIFSPWGVDKINETCIYIIINSLYNIFKEFFYIYTHIRVFCFLAAIREKINAKKIVNMRYKRYFTLNKLII